MNKIAEICIKNRISSIDFLKVIAIFSVILLHTNPFRHISWRIYFLVEQSARFAVPFFFIVSGYLFTIKIQTSLNHQAVFLRYIKKLTIYYVGWWFIYLFIPSDSIIKTYGILKGFIRSMPVKINWALNNPVTAIIQGTSVHLWFLVSLIIALLLLYFFIFLKINSKFLYLAVLLYVFGLLGGAYSHTSVGFNINFNTRNGPFLSSLFVGIGSLLAHKNYIPTIRFALFIFFAGMILHITEAYILIKYLGWVPTEYNYGMVYVAGTVLYASGFMLLAIAKPNLGRNTFITSLGRYTLGIYLSHLALIILSKNIPLIVALQTNFLWQFLYPVCVFTLSLAVTVVFERIAYLRRIVT